MSNYYSLIQHRDATVNTIQDICINKLFPCMDTISFIIQSSFKQFLEQF